MKRLTLTLLILSTALLLTLGTTINAKAQVAGRQSLKQKLLILRQYLNVPRSLPITIVKRGSVANVSRVKVYVFTGIPQDKRVHNNFLKWFDNWNLKEGSKYGFLEVVSDSSQSDVIIARFMDFDRGMNEARMNSSNGNTAPFYAYIINRKLGGLEVLFHYADDRVPMSDDNSGKVVCTEFFKLMKERTDE